MKPQDLQTLARAALIPPAAPAPTAAATMADKVDQLGAILARAVPRYNVSGDVTEPPAVTAAAALAAKVDQLGAISAEIAALKKKADKLRTDLEDAGLTNIEGQLYRVNFATVAGSTLTNWRAIAERLKASPQLIRAYTKTGESSTRMTVKAHPTH